MSLPKLNPVEPPWYVTRMPGGVGSPVIDRVIPLSEGCSAYAQGATGKREAGPSWRRSRASVGGNRLSSWLVGSKGGHDLRCHLPHRMPGERHGRDKTGNGSRRRVHHRDRNSAIGASFRLEPSGRAGP